MHKVAGLLCVAELSNLTACFVYVQHIDMPPLCVASRECRDKLLASHLAYLRYRPPAKWYGRG